MKSVTLITGADGYLGGKLAAHLLAQSDEQLVLAVRALPGTPGFDDKRARLEAALGDAALGRVAVVPADLSRDDAFSALEPDAITRIVHSAAVTAFNVPRDLAETVNVRGTARMAAFAARCENLQRLAVLSTLYTCGMRVGPIAEERHAEGEFANNYEWSKWAAEDLLWGVHPDLPLSVLRLPTVICEDEGGGVVQYNSFHNTLKLYYYGLLSLVPGDRSCRQYTTSASFVSPAIAHLLDPAVPPGTYHVVPADESVAVLEDLVEAVFAVFEGDRSYQRRGLLRPIYCDRESFDDLVVASRALRAGPIYEAIDSISPFATEMFLPKTFGNDRLRAVWPGYRAPDPVELAATVARTLVASRWGRNQDGER